MRARTPNFILNTSVTIGYGLYDTKTLPAGSYVRPISLQYVPQHLLDDPKWRDVDHEREVFCYTKIGMVLIPRKSISEA